MRAVVLSMLLGVALVIFGVIRYLSRSEHMRHNSGTDQFSPGDPAKTDVGPHTP